MESTRFDYVKYDQDAIESQQWAKDLAIDLETMITKIGYRQKTVSKETMRAKSLALTKLEECYAWIGKAIRNDQIARKGSVPPQEGRGDE